MLNVCIPEHHAAVLAVVVFLVFFVGIAVGTVIAKLPGEQIDDPNTPPAPRRRHR
jgi:hypothetical protein